MTAVKQAEVERAVRSRSPQISVLLFHGPDAGLVSERARAAAEAALSDGSDPFGLVRIDGDVLVDDPGRLLEEATTCGLFGERRVVLVRSTSRNIAAAVGICLDGAPDGTLVVVEGGNLAKSSPLRTLCETSARALALPCYLAEARDLVAFVNEAVAAEGLIIDREARDLLIDSLGGDRLATRGEIGKLALYCHGRGRITADDVQAVVSDVSVMRVDVAIDAAFTGDVEGLERALQHLAGDGAAPAFIQSQALAHALGLLKARLAIDGGGGRDVALRSWRGLHFTRKAAVEAQIDRWRSPKLGRVIAALQETTLQGRRNAAMAAVTSASILMKIAAAASGDRRT